VKHDGAADSRLLFLTHAHTHAQIAQAPLAQPSADNWKDLVPHKAGRLISSMTNAKGLLVRSEKVKALPRIVVATCACVEEAGQEAVIAADHVIDFPEEAYSLGMHGFEEFDSSVLRFTYSSPTTPESTIDYTCGSRDVCVRVRAFVRASVCVRAQVHVCKCASVHACAGVRARACVRVRAHRLIYLPGRVTGAFARCRRYRQGTTRTTTSAAD
jgi:hypothetical protein